MSFDNEDLNKLTVQIGAPDDGNQPPLADGRWDRTGKLRVGFDDNGVLYLSNDEPESFDTLGIANDHHALVGGGTRAGKGASFMIPNTLLWEGSAIIIDPKGENASVTARRRGDGSQYARGMGQPVYLLDPFGEAGRPDDRLDDLRAGFNPLADIDPNDPRSIDDVNNLVANLVPEKIGQDPYWTKGPRGLLKGVILHVLTSDDFEEEERHLVTVYRLLNLGDRKKKLFLEAIDADDIPPAHLLLYQAMQQNRAYDEAIAAAGETYADMMTGAPKQYLGVLEVLKQDMEFMDSPGVQACLKRSDFSLRDLKNDERGVTVYLCLPQSMMETHSAFLRTFIGLALRVFERQKYQPKSGAPILMMLDEFPALGRMKAIENGIAQMAGFGCKFVLAIQDLNQLKDLYKDKWQTFIANCGVKVFMSNEDHFTRDYASKLMGDMQLTLWNRTGSRSAGTNESVGITEGSSLSKTTGTSYTSGPGLNQYSSTESHSTSLTESFSRTDSKGSNASWSASVQQQVTTRPLVRPSEIGRAFAYRQEPNGLPYAGDTLVLLAGYHPFSVKRTLYYRHQRFEGLFDPHPDHPVLPPYRTKKEIIINVPAVVKPRPRPRPAPPPKPHWFKRFLVWLVRAVAHVLLVHVLPFLCSRAGVLWFWAPLGLATLILTTLIWAGVMDRLMVVILAAALEYAPIFLALVGV